MSKSRDNIAIKNIKGWHKQFVFLSLVCPSRFWSCDLLKQLWQFSFEYSNILATHEFWVNEYLEFTDLDTYHSRIRYFLYCLNFSRLDISRLIVVYHTPDYRNLYFAQNRHTFCKLKTNYRTDDWPINFINGVCLVHETVRNP